MGLGGAYCLLTYRQKNLLMLFLLLLIVVFFVVGVAVVAVGVGQTTRIKKRAYHPLTYRQFNPMRMGRAYCLMAYRQQNSQWQGLGAPNGKG